MNKDIPIIVLFGPSGSGKSFVADCLTASDDFCYIPKITNRERRTEDSSVKHLGGRLYLFDYLEDYNLREEELVFENYDKLYALKMLDIDRAIAQGRVPVIILRSREQMEALQRAYPDREIHKYYIRPDVDEVKQMIMADPTRSQENKQSRIEKLDSDFSYHDETARLDKDVVVLKNDYSGADEIVAKIKERSLKGERTTYSRADVARKIVIGDKIRISYEGEFSNNNKWFAKVISGTQEKFTIGPEDSFEALYAKVDSCLEGQSLVSANNNEHSETIEKLHSILDGMGMYSSYYGDMPYEDRKFIREKKCVTNWGNEFDRGRILLPQCVLDIEVDAHGARFNFCQLATAPIFQKADFDRDYDRRRYDALGWQPLLKPIRKSGLSLDTLEQAVEELILSRVNEYEYYWQHGRGASSDKFRRLCYEATPLTMRNRPRK